MAAAVVVTTMLVVMMMVVVFVRMVMTMAVIMIMIMRRMTVIVIMRFVRRVRVTLGISAALGIERRFDLDHSRAQSFDHRFDDVVAPDSQCLSHDLRRQVTIAEMPAEPHQMLRIVTADLQKRLRRGHDLDQPAIVEHQRIAAAQCDRILEIEQEFQPTRARHRHPPPVAVVEIEHDCIGCRLAPAMVRLDLRCADHLRVL